MVEPKVKPSRWYYALAAVVLVIGVVGMVALLLSGLADLEGHLQRVILPGRHELTLAEPGGYTVFLEHQSVMEGRVYSTDARSLSNLKVTLISARSGDAIPLEPPAAKSTYSMGGRSGVSVLRFEIESPGPYVLTGRYPSGAKGPEAVFAVGHGFLGKLLVTIFSCLGILFSSVLLCVALVLVVFLKRRKARRRREEGPPSGSPYEMPMLRS